MQHRQIDKVLLLHHLYQALYTRRQKTVMVKGAVVSISSMCIAYATDLDFAKACRGACHCRHRQNVRLPVVSVLTAGASLEGRNLAVRRQ